jgi:DNA polymerase III epsilon subunit family exonuclease
VAFDIETTGLEPILNRIVEIGGIKFQGDTILDSFNHLVDPDMVIPDETIRIHGITNDMVKGKPNIDQVLPDFAAFLDDTIPVAHNALFDVSFLAYDFSKIQLKPSPLPILDTCTLSRSLFPRLSSHSLENLAKQFDFVSKNHHRSLSDAEVCMRIFNRCVEKLGDPEKVTFNQLVRYNGPVFCFNHQAVYLGQSYQLITEAFQSGKSVEIVYQKSSGEETKRRITPLTVGYNRNVVMIEAFCHLRQEKRTFRLDRIVRVFEIS